MDLDAAAAPRRGAGGGRRSSLRRRFLAVNITVITLCAALLFGGLNHLTRERAEAELERRLDEVVRIQSSILAAPVWNIEEDRIRLILEAVLQDRDFVMALVSDESGTPLVTVGSAAGEDLRTTTSAIVKGEEDGGEIIGELTLVASKEHLTAASHENFIQDSMTLLLVLATTVVTALVVFRQTIERPLSQLLSAISQAKGGGTRQAVAWNSNDEIGRVIEQFNEMQQRQDQYETALRSARDTLETRVRERTEELSRARDQADAANTAKSEFLAIMSHELRTPLNGVLGLADLVLDSDLTLDQERSVAMIKESGTILLELLNDILDLSKIEAGRIELETLTFDFEDLLKRVEDFWAPIAQAQDLRFDLKVPARQVGRIHGDPIRLRQILFSFLGNAVKFTEEGWVRLNVGQEARPDGRIALRFEISDSGIGIDEETQAQLFKKFTQADSSTTRRFGGSGLGLAIAKELATLMGGTAGVESEPGRGSTFWFTIVCTPGAADACKDVFPHESAKHGPEARNGRALRILVAEDNATNQILITRILERQGHVPHLVGNGEEAVRALADGEFDLVLMDIQMPKMDGETATTAIRALPGSTGQIPIIALTANAMRGDRERYLDLGMNDYVSKPIDRRALDTAIRRCTGRDAGQETHDEGSAPTAPVLSARQQASLQDLLRGLPA